MNDLAAVVIMSGVINNAFLSVHPFLNDDVFELWQFEVSNDFLEHWGRLKLINQEAHSIGIVCLHAENVNENFNLVLIKKVRIDVANTVQVV